MSVSPAGVTCWWHPRTRRNAWPTCSAKRGLTLTSLTVEQFRALVTRRMSEEAWLQSVRAWAKALGWRTWHTRDSRRSDPGLPDLICLHPDGRILVAELKSERGKLTDRQAATLGMFTVCGVPAHVWRPSDAEWVFAILAGE